MSATYITAVFRYATHDDVYIDMRGLELCKEEAGFGKETVGLYVGGRRGVDEPWNYVVTVDGCVDAPSFAVQSMWDKFLELAMERLKIKRLSVAVLSISDRGSVKEIGDV